MTCALPDTGGIRLQCTGSVWVAARLNTPGEAPECVGCPLAAAQADTRQGKSRTPRTGGSIVWAAVWWEEWQQWEKWPGKVGWERCPSEKEGALSGQMCERSL